MAATRNEDRYEETLAWLLQLEAARGMDFKLERVERALEAVGNPHRAYRTIHVAGTNGKGSVSATCDAILRAAGRRTGLYTSPHLVDFRERIRVDGARVEREELVEYVRRIREHVDVHRVGLTFFEVTTIAAFLHFAIREVEVAVIEVGLGGRLDATNVIDGDVAVVTSIGFDHEGFLGNTLASIAREKAGILRSGRPAVVGHLPSEAMEAVVAQARMRSAPLLCIGNDFGAVVVDDGVRYYGPRRRLDALKLRLRGSHQVGNTAMALTAVDALGGDLVTDDAVRCGVGTVEWPGRLEVVRRDPLVIVDAAHNVDGIRILVEELDGLVGGGSIHLLFGVLGDKRWEEMVDRIAPRVASATVARVPVGRSADPHVVARRFAEYCPTDVVEEPAVATKHVLARTSSGSAMVVAGSIFLVGAVYPTLTTGAGKRIADADGSDTAQA